MTLEYDVVYSWGVLHHTGAMWLGIESAIQRVAEGGQLFIAIYNDQGVKSHVWWLIKHIYSKIPRPLNYVYAYGFWIIVNILVILKYTVKLKPMTAIRPYFEKNYRGMSIKHDIVEWMGGFPYEFSTYETLVEYIQSRGFVLRNSKKATSLGCHELVFYLPFSNAMTDK